MREGTTSNGFKFLIDENVFDDWDVVELLIKADNEDVGAFFDASKLILGDEQLNSLKKHIKGIHGKATFSIMVSTIKEIFDSVKETKN